MNIRNLFHRRNTSFVFRIISFGFTAAILTGTILLMLPPSTREEGGASFLDALFTATSATCVTGLVVHDTVSYWTPLGQFIIITLIQIGGMGVITVALLINMFSGRKIGLLQRSTMQEAIASPKVGGIVRLTGFILKTVIAFELAGALLMFPVFYRDFGLLRGIWYAIFHSISAFCNAGFDLMGAKEPFASLTVYAADPVISLTIAGLIAAGGIGFLTWDDVRKKGIHIKKYRMQSKVILAVTATIIFLPALYFYIFEFEDAPACERLLESIFQSVTPRTAGFNTVDLNRISETGQAIMIILMMIGGSPGSTAGGMKTTTVAVLLFSSIAVFKRRENAQCFGRQLPCDAVKRAGAVLMMYMTLLLVGGLLISSIEQLPVLQCLFEAASAIGTVGLTLGLTPGLAAASKIILILLMFFGRVGGLTLIFAAFAGVHSNVVQLPQEAITVG